MGTDGYEPREKRESILKFLRLIVVYMEIESYRKYFEGKKILVTGGAGSIGSEIIRQVLKFNPAVIRVLDINESGLFELEQELSNYKGRVAFLTGDIRDKDRIIRAMENIDIVFHAAALKHVHLCEYNPFEAIKSNVIGTQNVIDACLNNNVKKMVFISTDKAVNPNNVMGASKLLGERLTIAANGYKGPRDTLFFCVRFGNVLASRGSVIPLFRDQIRKGGPVTVTDPDMTRFIMSIPSSVKLILKATASTKGGEIFILKMPALRVGDLANAMIKELAPKFNHRPQDVKISVIGKRPGEKMDEELFSSIESGRVEMVDGELLAVHSESLPSEKASKTKTMSSKDGPFLKESEITDILRTIDFDSF